MATTAAPHRTRLGQILHAEGRKQTWLAEQAAERLGRSVGRSQISQYVHGLHPPEDMQRAIAEALGRKVADVFPEGS